MSNAILNRAWATEMASTDKLVLVSLADFAREDGRAWLPLEGPNGLIRRCGLTRRTVQRAIMRLVLAGHITRQERPGRGVLYTVHPQIGLLATVPPVSVTARTGAAVAPNPTGTMMDERLLAERPRGISPGLWTAFCEMRVAMGRPLTPRTAQLLLTRLSELAGGGASADAILNQSLLNGWANLYPLKSGSARSPRRPSTASARNPVHPPLRSSCSDTPMPSDRCTPAQATEIMRELQLARAAQAARS